MVKIRLARGGAKKRPFYHIVVTDQRSKRDGRSIERVGYYNPVAQGNEKRVELNTETRLRASISADGREAWLDQGEAYFEVAHDASRPFTVHMGDRTVNVLGTRFSVKR